MLLHVSNLEALEMCVNYDTVGFIGFILLGYCYLKELDFKIYNGVQKSETIDENASVLH